MDLVELAPSVSPAGDFVDRSSFVQVVEAGVSVSLERTLVELEVLAWPLALAVGRVGEPDGGRGRIGDQAGARLAYVLACWSVARKRVVWAVIMRGSGSLDSSVSLSIMAQYFVLLERALGLSLNVTARCAITGNSGCIGTSRAFQSLPEVIAAMTDAGISNHRFDMAASVIKSGFGGSFLPVSEEECSLLGLLKSEQE